MGGWGPLEAGSEAQPLRLGLAECGAAADDRGLLVGAGDGQHFTALGLRSSSAASPAPPDHLAGGAPPRRTWRAGGQLHQHLTRGHRQAGHSRLELGSLPWAPAVYLENQESQPAGSLAAIGARVILDLLPWPWALDVEQCRPSKPTASSSVSPRSTEEHVGPPGRTELTALYSHWRLGPGCGPGKRGSHNLRVPMPRGWRHAGLPSTGWAQGMKPRPLPARPPASPPRWRLRQFSDWTAGVQPPRASSYHRRGLDSLIPFLWGL